MLHSARFANIRQSLLAILVAGSTLVAATAGAAPTTNGLVVKNGFLVVNGLAAKNGLGAVNGLPVMNGIKLPNGLSSMRDSHVAPGVPNNEINTNPFAALNERALAADQSGR